MINDDEDYTDDDFENSLEKEDFDFWWDEEGSILMATSDDPQKEIAQAAWLAAWRFYTGNEDSL